MSSPGPLVDFLYCLLRDHLPVGVVEALVRDSENCHAVEYTNKHLEAYAREVTDRLLAQRPVRLWLDDERPMPEGYTHHAKTMSEAIALLATTNVVEASLDHDLGLCEACFEAKSGECEHYGTGYKLVLWMAENNVWPDVVRVHSQNPVGRRNMEETIKRYKS